MNEPEATYSYRVTITAGAERDKNDEYLKQRGSRLDLIRKDLAKQNGGYTETVSYGGWVGPKGQLVQEEALTWTMVVQDTVAPEIGEFTNREVAHEKASAWAAFIRDVLDQQTVMVSVEKVTTKFV